MALVTFINKPLYNELELALSNLQRITEGDLNT